MNADAQQLIALDKSSIQIHIFLGPVVQSIVSLTSLLVVKMLTVLVNTISNSYVFLLKKNVSSSAKILAYYAIFNDQNFNNMLTNDIVSFEQLGPDFCMKTYVVGTY